MLINVLYFSGLIACQSSDISNLEQSCNANQSSDCTQLSVHFFQQEDYESAMLWAKKACALNDAEGCFYVGALYNDGHGIEGSEGSKEAGKPWYEKSCAMGYEAACEQLTEVLYDPNNPEMLRQRLEDDCGAGEGTACRLLAEMQWDKKSNPSDDVRVLLQKGCEGKDATSCADLGNIYAEVDQNPQSALMMYETCCAQDSMECCHAQGQLQLELDQSPTPKVRALMQQACDKGAVQSCGHLGSIFSDEDANFDKAVPMLTVACEGGYMDACNRMGVLYQKGKGVNTDLQKAQELYQKACVKEEVRACVNLGYMYLDGTGVEKDFDKARQYLDAACLKGDAEACVQIGELYGKGIGVEQSDKLALEWFQKACKMVTKEPVVEK